MQGTWTSLAALALAMSANCHMIMLTPTPFNNETIDNSPLDSSGSNFPCKSTGSQDFYNANGIKNTMAIGETQTLSFRGSAVHGGGSCQLAITKDKAPTASTTWSVIQSIEGGCPSIDGTAPSTYKYTIPNGVPPGDYVFAWTWVSKMSGAPEYYMNCAPITVTGGSSKLKAKRHGFKSKRDSLPNLAVFNLGSVNQCKSTLSSDPTYADPGANLVKPPGTRNYQPISGTNCFPDGGTAAGDLSGGSGSSGGSSGNDSATGAAPAASSTPAAAGAVSSGAPGAYTPSPAGAAPSAAGAATPSAAGAATPSTTPAATPPAAGAATSSVAGAAGATNLSSSSSVVATPVTSGGVTAVPSLSFPGAGPASSPSAAAASGSGPGAGASAVASASPSAAASGSGSATEGSGSAVTSAADTGATPSEASGSFPSDSTPANPGSSPTTTPVAGGGSAGTSGGLTGPCTDEGIYNCIGGNSFQRCASGQWSAMLPMPGGTTCKLGQSQDLWARTLEYAFRRYRRYFRA